MIRSVKIINSTLHLHHSPPSLLFYLPSYFEMRVQILTPVLCDMCCSSIINKFSHQVLPQNDGKFLLAGADSSFAWYAEPFWRTAAAVAVAAGPVGAQQHYEQPDPSSATHQRRVPTRATAASVRTLLAGVCWHYWPLRGRQYPCTHLHLPRGPGFGKGYTN